MKRWKAMTVACLAAACLSLALVGCQSGEYTPEQKDPQVSASALGQAGTLRVGVNASSAPLAGKTTSTSRIVGIDVDVASYLADELGLDVEVIDVSDNFTQALENGTVDVVLGVDSSEEGSGYWRSSPYLDTGVALFGASTETSVPTTDSSPKVAAQSSSKSSWRVTNLFGDSALVSQTELKAAFDALANGSARYVAADAVIGTYVSYSSGYSDKIVALLQDPSGYCAAVGESNTELQNAVGNAVAKLVNGGIMGIIENKWLGQALDLSSMTVVKSAAAESSSNSASAEAETTEDEEGAEGTEGEEGGEAEATGEGETAETGGDAEVVETEVIATEDGTTDEVA